MTDRAPTSPSLLTPAQLDAISDGGWGADTDEIDNWTEATGLDLGERTVARLLALDNGIDRGVRVSQLACEWSRGVDARYLNRNRQGTKFSHSRHTITLEITVSLDHAVIGDAMVAGNDWGNVTVLVQADRLGRNGKIRNARVSLGYTVGADDQHFVACEDSPNARSVAIYRAMGMTDQADAMQRQIDDHARYLDTARARHGLR